jgi:hypothetical protein
MLMLTLIVACNFQLVRATCFDSTRGFMLQYTTNEVYNTSTCASCLISACASSTTYCSRCCYQNVTNYRAGQWEKSLELLDEILQLGWQPTRYSRNAAMDACGKVSAFNNM